MMKKKLFLAFMAFATLAMTGCSNDDNATEQPNVPERQDVTGFDDLEFFQEYFINVDSLGNFVSRSIGIPLPVYDEDTTHIFIGVEDLDEAITYWDGCQPFSNRRREEEEIGPVDPKPRTSSTYTLTDKEGRSQGTVSFAPSTEPGFVADITTDLPGLRHFKKVTFVQNDSWPVDFTEGQYHFGDVRTFTFTYRVSWDIINTVSVDTTKTRTMKFVCIREKSRGVKPLYVSITPDEIDLNDDDKCLLVSDYCPGESKAKMIYRILYNFSFSYAMELFARTGEGALKHDEYYWIDDHSFYLYWAYWGAIRLFDGDLDSWEYQQHLPKKHALLKIDWLDE